MRALSSPAARCGPADVRPTGHGRAGRLPGLAENAMSEPTRVCPACYGFNRWSAERCQSCGAALENDDDLESRLIWALGHPDTATAMRAADALAVRQTKAAIGPLAELLDRVGDPYRSAAAARALAAFAGDPDADAALARVPSHPSVVVRSAIKHSKKDLASLNADQRRAVVVALRQLEERLGRIEEILDHDEFGVLHRRSRPRLSSDQSERVGAILTELRTAIASVAETHSLPAEERDSGREIAGLLRISWESLAEIDSRRLAAYGRVDPGLRASLDPTLERMMALVMAVEEIVVGRARRQGMAPRP